MFVPGIGPRRAKIVIVGEAPGQSEEQQGIPFVGSSGQLLNSMLLSVGIQRSECYVTNVVKSRPAKNDFGIFYEDKRRLTPSDMLRDAWTKLSQEVCSREPNIVIALGNEAMRALTGKTGIDKWRGSIQFVELGLRDHKKTKVIGTYHPAYVLRMMETRPIVEIDLARALKHSLSPDWTPEKFDFLLNPSFERVMEFLADPPRKLVFDIETTGQTTRCLGFAWSGKDAICIPFISNRHSIKPGTSTVICVDGPQGQANSHWTPEEEWAIIQGLDRLFRDKTIRKIAQNFPFDSTILERNFGFVVKGLEMDTMLAHHAVYPELPKSLDFLCSFYTEIPRYSDYQVADDYSTWTYNCMDCCVTFRVHELLQGELAESGLSLFLRDHIQPTMMTVTRMQNRGVKINLELRDKIKKHYLEEIDNQWRRIQNLTGEALNPDSPKQMQEYLYKKLRLPMQMDKKTKKPTASEEALMTLKRSFPQYEEVFDKIIAYRNLRTVVSSILSCELIGDRLFTSYNVAGTVNGRLSSSKTIFGTGFNLQNVPRGPIRRMFIPDEGMTWIKLDLSQAEARVVAWVAKIWKLIRSFQDPRFDIHRWNATNIFGCSEDEVTKPQREIAKAGVHGGNYGLGARTAAILYNMSYQDAERSLNAYRRALPELAVWWRDVNTQLTRTRTLVSPLGRRRVFLGRLDEALFRSGYSFIPQATVVDVINRLLYIGEVVLRRLGCVPVLQVHDEVDFVCPENHLAEALPIIKRIAEYPISVEGVPDKLVIPCEISTGTSWFDVKKVTIE